MGLYPKKLQDVFVIYAEKDADATWTRSVQYLDTDPFSYRLEQNMFQSMLIISHVCEITLWSLIAINLTQKLLFIKNVVWSIPGSGGTKMFGWGKWETSLLNANTHKS